VIKKLSLVLAQAISHNIETDQQIEVYAYGLEIILGSFTKLISLLILSYFLGISWPMLFVLLSFIPMRLFGGGVHLSTYLRCLVLGVLMLLILARLSLVNVTDNFLLFFLLFVTLVTAQTVYRWVPAGTEKKTIVNPKLRAQQKIKTIRILLGIVTASLILLMFDRRQEAFALLVGLGASSLLMTPFGYKPIRFIDNLLDIPNKGGEN